MYNSSVNIKFKLRGLEGPNSFERQDNYPRGNIARKGKQVNKTAKEETC